MSCRRGPGRVATGGERERAMKDATDQELVAQVLGGNKRAFSTLYQRHQPALSRRLHRVLGRLDDVEEVVQVTFIEAYGALKRYQPERPFSPWLQGIGVRQAMNHLRRRKRRSWLSYGADAEAGAAPQEHAQSTEDKAIQRQLARLLYDAMEGLPPKKRVAFTLHELEGLGFTEIGEIVGASPQTVRARVLSARDTIQKQMRRRGLTLPAVAETSEGEA